VGKSGVGGKSEGKIDENYAAEAGGKEVVFSEGGQQTRGGMCSEQKKEGRSKRGLTHEVFVQHIKKRRDLLRNETKKTRES